MNRLTRPRRVAPALAALTALAALAAPSLAAKGELELVSRADGPSGAAATMLSFTPSISADGDQVAFLSSARNLAPDDANRRNDIFVRGLEGGTTTLASRASGAVGEVGNDHSEEPSISADGRFVAFVSRSTNLTGEEVTGVRHVFVRDLRENTTTLVDRATGPAGAVARSASFTPSISGDGRFVAFGSVAPNLSQEVGSAAPFATRIYVRDLQTGTTTLVSRGDGPQGAIEPGDSPSISRDGRHVAFDSVSATISDEDSDATSDIFLRDLQTGSTTLVSRPTAAGAPADGSSGDPHVSADGRFVVFGSGAANLSDADDDSPGPFGGGTSEIYVRDVRAGTTTLASGSLAEAGLASARWGSVSDDGRHVAFQGFSPAGGNDVFVRDLATGVTTLVSHAAAAVESRAGGYFPVLSGDGRFVAFVSSSDAISDQDSEGNDDVFRRDVLGPPPGAPSPACAPAPGPTTGEPAAREARFTLTRRQLLINQRIAQAAIRRLNAVQERLDGGLSARDLCGYGIGAEDLVPAIQTTVAPASLAPTEVAAPEPVRAAPREVGQTGTVRLSAAQLLINQRIGQAAVRRANGIAARLAEGLTGGDILDGQVVQAKLADRLRVTAAPATPAPAPGRTVIPPREAPPDPGAVRLTVAQLRINQRVYQAAVRRANALVARLEAGFTGADIRDGSLTVAELAAGVVGEGP